MDVIDMLPMFQDAICHAGFKESVKASVYIISSLLTIKIFPFIFVAFTKLIFKCVFTNFQY